MPKWIHDESGNIRSKNAESFSALREEFDHIFKMANLITSGAKYIGSAVPRALSEGGRKGQALTAGFTGLGLYNELKDDQDPSGMNRGKSERAGRVLGGTFMGALGGVAGADIGRGIVRDIDPRDKLLTRAVPRIQTAISKLPEDMGEAKIFNMALMDNALKNKSFSQRWARRGLGLIPAGLGIAGALYGNQVGEKLFGNLFRRGQTPQPQQQIQQNQIQPVDQTANI